MGLIETELKELRRELKVLDEREMDYLEKLRLKLGIYGQTSKRSSLKMQGMILSQKTKAFKKSLYDSGLSDDSVVIDPKIEELGNDYVRCEDQHGRIITRDQCLDRSGSSEHFEQCRQCPKDKTTRAARVHSP